MRKTIVPSETHSLRRKVMELMNENQNLKIMAKQFDEQNIAMIARLLKTKRALLEILNLSPGAITEFEMLCHEKENMLHNETIHQEIELLLRQLRILMKYLLFSDEAGKREIEETRKKEEP